MAHFLYFNVGVTLLGTRLGSYDVLSWIETKAPHMRINGVDNSKVHYISITAVNKAGLHTTLTTTASYGQ